MTGQRPDSGDVVIVDAARSPFGQRGSQLKNWHPASLAGATLNGLLERTGLRPTAIDSLLLGCVSQVGAQSMNIARNAALSAHWPTTVSATTVGAQHTSAAQALQLGYASVKSGCARMVIAGGVESTTQVPLGTATVDQQYGYAFGNEVNERFSDLGGIQTPGGLSERLAQQTGLTRPDLDAYTLESRRRALTAQKNQLLDNELVQWPTTIDQSTSADELTTSYDVADLADLEPCFNAGGVTTAAHIAPAADGAALVLLADADLAASVGLATRARILGFTHVGHDMTGNAPYSAAATTSLLEKCSMRLTDIDIFEIQETFASTPLVWAQACGVDIERCNRHGGALAFGDPAGASPIKLIVSALNQLERSKLRFALVVSDGADGHVSAVVIERLEH